MTVIVDEHLTDLDRVEPGSEIVDCVIEGVSAERVDLTGLRIEGTRFVDCHLRLADVTGTRFNDVQFLRCGLTGVDWTAAEWSSFNIGPALKFADCQLDYGSFHGLFMQDLVLYACKAVDVDFGECDLTDADLRFTDLAECRFDGATLIGANLSGATGYVFDLTNARAKGCVVTLPDAAALLRVHGLDVREPELAEPPERVLG